MYHNDHGAMKQHQTFKTSISSFNCEVFPRSMCDCTFIKLHRTCSPPAGCVHATDTPLAFRVACSGVNYRTSIQDTTACVKVCPPPRRSDSSERHKICGPEEAYASNSTSLAYSWTSEEHRTIACWTKNETTVDLVFC